MKNGGSNHRHVNEHKKEQQYQHHINSDHIHEIHIHQTDVHKYCIFYIKNV